MKLGWQEVGFHPYRDGVLIKIRCKIWMFPAFDLDLVFERAEGLRIAAAINQICEVAELEELRQR